MSQLAIGIIETIGLAAAIEAADVMTKSANVNLIGYELTRGNGMTVVKIEGNVGAVKAAIEAATIAANKVSRVYSRKVIPRPSDSIECLIRNKDTVGYKSDDEEKIIQQDINSLEEINTEIVSNDKVDTDNDLNEKDTDDSINKLNLDVDDAGELENLDELDSKEINEADIEDESDKDDKDELDKDDEEDDDSNKGYTCNLCKDPKCPRQKGDLKIDCIHYDEGKDN